MRPQSRPPRTAAIAPTINESIAAGAAWIPATSARIIPSSPAPEQRESEHAETLSASLTTTHSTNLSSQQSSSIDKEWMMGIFGNLNANIEGKFDQQNTKVDNFMLQTANLFKASAEDAQRREIESKEYVQKAISEVHDRFQESFLVRDQESHVMARDQIALTSQVSHLTDTVAKLREQISAQADFAVDAIQQVRDEVAGEATNAGGAKGPEANTSSSSSHTQDRIGKPESSTLIPGPYSVTCAYCDGDVPKVIAKQCQDCKAHFHPAHYPAHREEWPCPQPLDNWCLWCNQPIREEQNKAHCALCHCDLHTDCHSDHNPCPEGWIAKSPWETSLENLPGSAPEIAVPAEVPTDVQSMVARIEALEATAPKQSTVGNERPSTQKHVTPAMAAKASGYPLSPVRQPPGIQQNDGMPVNLTDTLVAQDQSGNTGFAVQYSKPREADSVKLMAFPKPGTGFEKWWDHALDSISSSTSYCTEAYRWTLVCEKSETTFESLGNSGNFVRLDALLLTALMECIPGDTHLLRQQIKKAKSEQRQAHERNIIGRQVLWMTYQYFAMNEQDKNMTDMARLHKVILANGDLQQFVYRWDEMLSIMKKRPTDEDLMNLFVLQLDVNLPKNHEFGVEYLLWYNKAPTDPIRTYEGIWTLIHDWVRRKRDTKNRREALKDHLPGLGAAMGKSTGDGKGSGKDRSQMTCFQWRDKGICAKHDAGTCEYAHPKALKGTGKSKGDGKDNGKKGKKGHSSGPDGHKRGKGGGGARSASPKRTVETDRAKLCPFYFKGECKKGNKCLLHHNGPCRFHSAGTCTKGDKCLFTHWNVDKGANLALGATAPPTSGDGKPLIGKAAKAAAKAANAQALKDQ